MIFDTFLKCLVIRIGCSFGCFLEFPIIIRAYSAQAGIKSVFSLLWGYNATFVLLRLKTSFRLERSFWSTNLLLKNIFPYAGRAWAAWPRGVKDPWKVICSDQAGSSTSMEQCYRTTGCGVWLMLLYHWVQRNRQKDWRFKTKTFTEQMDSLHWNINSKEVLTLHRPFVLQLRWDIC